MSTARRSKYAPSVDTLRETLARKSRIRVDMAHAYALDPTDSNADAHERMVNEVINAAMALHAATHVERAS